MFRVTAVAALDETCDLPDTTQTVVVFLLLNVEVTWFFAFLVRTINCHQQVNNQKTILRADPCEAPSDQTGRTFS
jgi:hypothetical protein